MEHLLPRPHGTELVGFVSEVLAGVQWEADQRNLARRRGRPVIDIPEDQLSIMLLEHRFSIADIGRMMRVSACTIRRHVLQYGLPLTQLWPTVS